MKVIIPIKASQMDIAKRQAECISRLGALKRHSAVLFFEAAFEDNIEIANLYGNAFGSISTKHYPRKHLSELQWMNGVFYNSCVSIDEPFLWLEVTSAPLHEKWLDMIEVEYRTNNALYPYLGVLIENKVLIKTNDEKGEIIEQVITKGNRMHRVGVYPQKCYERKELQGIIDTLYNSEDSFDFKLSSAISGLTKVSEFIQCNNGSIDYREEDGKIKCNKVGEYGINDDLRENVLLLTGCVDDSVFNVAGKVKVKVDGSVLSGCDSEENDKIKQMEKRIKELEALISNAAHVIKPIENDVAIEDVTGRVRRSRKPKELEPEPQNV